MGTEAGHQVEKQPACWKLTVATGEFRWPKADVLVHQ